jgi:adenosylhomocysteine nucleosidase
MSILIICALESELTARKLPANCKLIYSGVGKVNSAIATFEGIVNHKPSLVINFGTVGKINASLKGLYEVKKVLQADMCAMPLSPRGTTPFDFAPHEYYSGQGGVICATSDSFITSIDPWFIEKQVDIVEMELFAIAHTCTRLKTPWRSFKFITDDVNDNSHSDWHENVNKGEELFLKRLSNI